MEEQFKIDFNKVIKNLKPSKKDIELRKKILVNLLKMVFLTNE